MQTLNAELLNSRSATATLESWCSTQRLAKEPKIVARHLAGAVKAATPEMNRLLETTDTSFGRVVASLEPYRTTISTRTLWNGQGAAPAALFEHRALLYTRDHQPFSEVVEIYQRHVLPAIK
jgi:hypothetical protein